MVFPYLRSSFLAVLFFAGYIGAVQAQDVTALAAPSHRNNKNNSSDDNVNITTANPVVFMKNIGRGQSDHGNDPFQVLDARTERACPYVTLIASDVFHEHHWICRGDVHVIVRTIVLVDPRTWCCGGCDVLCLHCTNGAGEKEYSQE